MQIVIDIPKEFEEHFNFDRFEDSLQRARHDIHKSIIANKSVLSGNYDIETLDMLTEAFLTAIPLPKGHGRLIDADELYLDIQTDEEMRLGEHLEWVKERFDRAPTIIEADKESEE